MFQIVPYLMSDLSWTFHENLFIRFFAMLPTDTDFSEKLCSREPSGNAPDCSLYQFPTSLKNSWNSVHAFFSNVANRQSNRNEKSCRLNWMHYFKYFDELHNAPAPNLNPLILTFHCCLQGFDKRWACSKLISKTSIFTSEHIQMLLHGWKHAEHVV